MINKNIKVMANNGKKDIVYLDKTIHVRLSSDDYKQLNKLTRQNKAVTSELIRKLIKDYINSKRLL